MAKKHPTPHDRLFRSTFSHRSEVILFIKKFFPAIIYKQLDFRTLKMQNTSFINDKLENNYSDINYSCKWKNSDKEVLITFLFEHKSYYVEFPEFQLMRYILEGYEYQMKQEDPHSLIVPVLIYHGKKQLKETSFLEGLGLPDPSFAKYFPSFEFIKVDLGKFTDEQLLAIGKTFLTASLLLFKHKKEKEFILKHYREIFIFVESYKNRDTTERFAETLILYIYQSFTIKAEEFKEIFEDLPKNLSDMFVSTYDMAVEQGQIKGRKIGMEEGMEKGMEKGKLCRSFEVVFTSFAKKPEITDILIGELSELELRTIRSLRKAFEAKDGQSAQKIMTKTLKPLAPITKGDEKQIAAILDKFFKK